MIKTYQKASTLPPVEKDKNIGILIGCANCSVARVFNITNTLKEIEDRRSSNFLIETVCEKCGHLIGVAIGWIDASKEGYSYRKMSLPPAEFMTNVVDDNGLREIHE